MRQSERPKGSGAWFAIAIASLLIAGCTSLTRLDAVPAAAEDRATVVGLPGIRYWGDGDPAAFRQAMAESIKREQSWLRAAGHSGALPPAEALAISGGSADGAFGAGLLVGWTANGTRPEFKVVTGVSTGALAAPFVFLGPAYDGKLKEIYTTISSQDILRPRGYLAVLFQDAFADSTPLRRTIARHLDQAMLEAIAAEHAKGRVLLVGTTNLDARRPVIWNIGQIAASRHPQALELVHDILVASASVPGALPPVMMDVDVDGKAHQEMHVDGGVSAQVFVYPPGLNVRAPSRAGQVTRELTLYVIRNARLRPEWEDVPRNTFSILGRALWSLIQTQGVGDLYRIYLAAQRDGIDFNLAHIPEAFTTPFTQPFDTEYMNELFRLGYGMGVAGYPWAKAPPGYAERTRPPDRPAG